jgi:hypothetical protein
MRSRSRTRDKSRAAQCENTAPPVFRGKKEKIVTKVTKNNGVLSVKVLKPAQNNYGNR